MHGAVDVNVMEEERPLINSNVKKINFISDRFYSVLAKWLKSVV